MPICQYKGCEADRLTILAIPTSDHQFAGEVIKVCDSCRADIFENRELYKKERARQRTKAWREANPEKARESSKAAAKNAHLRNALAKALAKRKQEDEEARNRIKSMLRTGDVTVEWLEDVVKEYEQENKEKGTKEKN